LEQKYPELSPYQTLSYETSLSSIIKYITLFVIFASVIITVSIIILSGVQYLSSTGKPEIMKQARTRIFNSFLGLLILIGSYLILSALNPQLLVMKIGKVPIEASVILLSEKGLYGDPGAIGTGFIGGVSIEQLVAQGEARYVNYEIKDFKNKFGELTAETLSPTKVNFKNFKPEYIGFLGPNKQNIKVIAYSEPNFEGGVPHEYQSAGKINNQGGIINQPVSLPLGLADLNISIVSLVFFTTEVDFTNIEGIQTSDNIPHPPLSFKIKSEGAGVYLYKEGTRNEREERYFENSSKRLALYNFDNEAKKIKIRNNPGNNYYLVVLHEDEDFFGELRIFFHNKTRAGQTTGNIRDDIDEVSINEQDQYGKIDGVSSIELFELAPPEELTCKEVLLCTEPGFEGECISYFPSEIPDEEREREIGIGEKIVTLQYAELPIYNPQDIIDDFNDNIKSINIDGKCLVVLFENTADKNPGSNSETFTEDEEDLTQENHEIGSCRTVSHFGWIIPQPCASAIAIYPIK